MTGGTFEMDKADNGAMVIGRYGTGTFDISGDASFSSTCMIVGETGTGVGTVNLSGDATLNLSGSSVEILTMGKASGAVATFNQSGGMLKATGNGSWIHIGKNSGSTATYNMTGGVLDIRMASNGGFVVGSSGNGTLNVSNDASFAAQALIIAEKAGSVGVVNLGEGGTITVHRNNYSHSLEAGNVRHISRTESSLLRFNKPVTVAEGASVIPNGGASSTFPENDPVFNDDVTIEGSYTPFTTLSIAAGKTLSGKGGVNGNLATGSGAKLAVEIGEGGAVSPLTVSGTANLAGASLELSGTENIADAAKGTRIVLFGAGAIVGWQSQIVEIARQPWRIVTRTVTDETTSTTYQALTAIKGVDGLMLIVK